MLRITRNTKGASLVEYGILVGLLSVLSIGSVVGLGRQTETAFKSPTAILNWFVSGVTENYPARYRFTAQASPSESTRIGVDGGDVSGDSYGSFDEASFEDIDLRSLQYDSAANTLEIIIADNATSLMPGHEMRCMDLSLGDPALSVDFDEAHGFYFGAFKSTVYTVSTSEPPFAVGQELACVIEKK